MVDRIKMNKGVALGYGNLEDSRACGSRLWVQYLQ